MKNIDKKTGDKENRKLRIMAYTGLFLVMFSSFATASGINITWITDSLDNVIAAKDTFINTAEFMFELFLYGAFYGAIIAALGIGVGIFAKLGSSLTKRIKI